MPFTTVPDKAALAVISGSDWDTYIRDNLNFLGAKLADSVIGYAEFTTPVTITALTPASAQQVVDVPAISFAASTDVVISFQFGRTTQGGIVDCWLYDNGVQGQQLCTANNSDHSLNGRCFITAAAGSHHWSVRINNRAAPPNASVIYVGTGIGTDWCPGFLRIDYANGTYTT